MCVCDACLYIFSFYLTASVFKSKLLFRSEWVIHFFSIVNTFSRKFTITTTRVLQKYSFNGWSINYIEHEFCIIYLEKSKFGMWMRWSEVTKQETKCAERNFMHLLHNITQPLGPKKKNQWSWTKVCLGKKVVRKWYSCLMSNYIPYPFLLCSFVELCIIRLDLFQSTSVSNNDNRGRRGIKCIKDVCTFLRSNNV